MNILAVVLAVVLVALLLFIIFKPRYSNLSYINPNGGYIRCPKGFSMLIPDIYKKYSFMINNASPVQGYCNKCFVVEDKNNIVKKIPKWKNSISSIDHTKNTQNPHKIYYADPIVSKKL